MSDSPTSQEYLKCSSFGSAEWTRRCVDVVRVAKTAEGYADEFDDWRDVKYTYACSKCGKTFDETPAKGIRLTAHVTFRFGLWLGPTGSTTRPPKPTSAESTIRVSTPR